ncbi:MAG TPA: hypothetical protein VK776_01860 [Bryobacteraceae bacterium]|jgi:hypothetical protein|nr:hypothetical protein [Bryobacteraceae bacterium]
MRDSTVLPNGADRAAGRASLNRASINRANAQHSTGPRSEAGKQRSSLNALRHGLTGQVIVLPTEDLAAYQRHSQSFMDEYQPKGANETQLVQSLLDTAWQVNRAATIALNLLTLGLTELEDRICASHPEAEAGLVLALAYREQDRAYINIGIQRQRLSRQYERTLGLIREVQAERRATEQLQLDNAAKILKMHKDQNLPTQPATYNPADDGFVFSTAEIETHLGREERRQQANLHDFEAHA